MPIRVAGSRRGLICMKFSTTSPPAVLVRLASSSSDCAISQRSFFESEIYRLSQREIKLSEMYTVYWEYVEKARRFVRQRGDSHFGQERSGNARTSLHYLLVPTRNRVAQEVVDPS